VSEPTGLVDQHDNALEDARATDHTGLLGLHPGVWWVAAAFALVEVAVGARYGFHRDELYFVVAGRHPALGYVDQPPLAPLVTRVATLLFGTSPSAVRIVPALAGGGVVLGTALIARLLGGRGVAQVLAALAIACAPITLAAAHLANTTVYDILAWTTAVAAILLAVRHGHPKAWLAAGVAVGLGLENKDLLLLLVVSAAVGVLAAGPRRVFLDRWLWAGAAVAVALWAPNLVWQAMHHWPELAMSRALRAQHSAGGDYLTVLPAQFIYLGLAAAPLAVVGVRRLIRDRSVRFLAIATALVALFVVVDVPGRPYYTDGLLPLVFAVGAVVVEQRAESFRAARRWLLAPLVGLAVTIPVILPVLPQAALAHIGGIHKLNYDLTETIGWPQLTAQVLAVYDHLSPDQRNQSAIFTNNYGEASALVVYGAHRLPPVLSGHNSVWMWGPGRAPDGTVITVGAADQLAPHFGTCSPAAIFHSPHDVPNDENGVQISICTHPLGPWSSFWNQVRHYD